MFISYLIDYIIFILMTLAGLGAERNLRFPRCDYEYGTMMRLLGHRLRCGRAAGAGRSQAWLRDADFALIGPNLRL